MEKLPWEGMESIEIAHQLYTLVERIEKRHRKQFPATGNKLLTAASNMAASWGAAAYPSADQPASCVIGAERSNARSMYG